MKNLILIFVFITLNFTAFSQQEYTWDEYGISFTLADDFQEQVNNGEEFSASGDGMELTILPFKDESVAHADITSYTLSIASSMNFERIDDVSVIEFNGFKGGYAEGVSEGVKLFIMGLMDPDSDTNFFVIIAFTDKDKYAIEEAINICKSIKRM